MSYAGNISPKDAWALLAGDPKAQLVDVRTTAEWNYVGVPNLATLKREPILVEWQSFPSMSRNPQFETMVVERLKAAGVLPGTPIAFLCRSGARSQAAAIAMTAAGYSKCLNISSGFEGDLDADRHRSHTSGWKADGLPWVQA